MGSSNKAPRHKLEYTSDYPNKKVYPKDCVPMNRPHGSWTNGVKAYERGTGGSSDTWVGWFHPPRLRNKGWKNRRMRQTHYNQFSHPYDDIEDEDVKEQLIHDAGYPEVQEEE